MQVADRKSINAPRGRSAMKAALGLGLATAMMAQWPVAGAQSLPWMNTSLKPAQRATLLVNAMTLAEKQQQLVGNQPEIVPELPQTDAALFPGVRNVAGQPEVTYKEGRHVGYRWYDAKGISPAFPFGHALSYTTFALSQLEVTPRISIDQKASNHPLGYWDSGAQDWAIADGQYGVYVANTSRNVLLSDAVTIRTPPGRNR